jgi:hypothetical protein
MIETYCILDKEEIVNRDHYTWHFDNLVTVNATYNFGIRVDDCRSMIGSKASDCWKKYKKIIYKKVNLEDYRSLDNEEIVGKEHYCSHKDNNYLILRKASYDYELKETAGCLRQKCNLIKKFNIYSKIS